MSNASELAVLISIGVSAELAAALDSIAKAVPVDRLDLRTEEEYSTIDNPLWPGVVVVEAIGAPLRQVEDNVALASSSLCPPTICQARILVADKPTFELTANAFRIGYLDVLLASGPGSVLELAADLEIAIRSAVADSYRRSALVQRTAKVRSAIDSLSAGEVQVMYFVMEGSLNKRIAKNLGISERTVEARRKRIFEKTSTSSVAKLVRLIVETVGVDEIAARCEQPQSATPPPHFNTGAISRWSFLNRTEPGSHTEVSDRGR